MFCWTGNDPQIIRNSRPFFVKTSNPGPVLRHDHHQEVGVGAVRGEHWSLPAHLAPVPACAGLAQAAQVDGLLVAEVALRRSFLLFVPQCQGGRSHVKIDSCHLVSGDWVVWLPRQVTEVKIKIIPSAEEGG